MILCLGPTPALQRVMVFPRMTVDAVNRATTTIDGVAGKSINVAKISTLLGGSALATGFVGGESGQRVLAELNARGIAHQFVPVPPATRQCITIVDQSAGTHTELVEESRPVPGICYDQLLAIVAGRLPECRALVMSGTLTPGGPADFYRRCIELANACGRGGLLTILDAQRDALLAALPLRPGLVKPNRAELAAALGMDLPDEPAVRQGMRLLHERGAQRVVVTAGKGPTLAFDGKHWWRLIPPAVQALSPIGSGDSATAAIVLHLLAGDDLGEACRHGSAAGAANALTWMSGDLDPAEVIRLLPLVGAADAG
jgi:tagatose 6-phosphate kinase